MERVYLSFLGRGAYDRQTGRYSYRPARYRLNGKTSRETPFVQVAEIALIGAENFDRLLIVMTPTSREQHYRHLLSELQQEGVVSEKIHPIEIPEDFRPETQWQWFEKILLHIDMEDELTVDLTHGYRIIPIIFSTAINFLHKARNIELKAVYYGAFEVPEEVKPIVDMKEFYTINEWAEGVSRLVEDADARKLVEVASQSPEFQVRALHSPEVIQALKELTLAIRNVQVNQVAPVADRALQLIQKQMQNSSAIGNILFHLIVDKFSALTLADDSGQYTYPYFRMQLKLIDTMIEHKLYMQAYTSMRELIGSLGLVKIPRANYRNSRGRDIRKRFADVFINMFQYSEEEWNFRGKEDVLSTLLPIYQELQRIGVERLLRGEDGVNVRKLLDYRNGFAHAWTSKRQVPEDIEQVAVQARQKLEECVEKLREHHYFPEA